MVKVIEYAVETRKGESQPIDRVLVNHGTYIGKLLKTDARVHGRLKCDRHTDFYRDILGADEETVGIIQHGYRIPFNSLPPETGVVPNNKYCLGKEEFFWSEMLRFTQLGCVQEVDGPSRGVQDGSSIRTKVRCQVSVPSIWGLCLIPRIWFFHCLKRRWPRSWTRLET